MCVFGEDFRFMNAFQYYENLDAMISYMNLYHGDRYVFKYSTPSQYVDAVASHNIEWPVKFDDLFPYSDNPNAYWTGYFSSRANDKEYIRRASSSFHAQNFLYSKSVLEDTSPTSNILQTKYDFMDVMGIEQHHDAVSGTGRQRIANDYAWRISKVMDEAAPLYSQMIEKEVNLLSGFASNQTWSQCSVTNSTFLDCPIAEFSNSTDFQMTVAVQNPSSIDLKVSKIPVPHGNFTVEKFCQVKQ
jgi:alpha-mannosidase